MGTIWATPLDPGGDSLGMGASRPGLSRSPCKLVLLVLSLSFLLPALFLGWVTCMLLVTDWRTREEVFYSHVLAGDALSVSEMLREQPELAATAPGPKGIGPMPLHVAAQHGRAEIARLLLAKGAPVNLQDDMGMTPLLWAVSKDHGEVVKLLLAHGADVNIREHGGWCAMHWASARDDLLITELLLQHGAEVELRKADGVTPLLTAVASGAMRTFGVLLARGADLKARDNAGRTALHLAAQIHDDRMLRAILDNPNCPDIQPKDVHGRTALHMARQSRYQPNIDLLTQRGAR